MTDSTSGLNSGEASDDPGVIVLRWSVQPGESIEADQELLVLAVGSEVQVIRAPVPGVLLNHWTEEGDRLGRGETLGWIRPSSSEAAT